MNKVEAVVNKMIDRPYILNMGAGKLSSIFDCTRDEIYLAKMEARRIIRTVAKPKKEEEENLELKSKWQNAKGDWLKSYKVKKEENDSLDPADILQVIEKVFSNTDPIRIDYKQFNTAKALNIWITDEHIGADTKNGLFDNDYDYEELQNRMDKILDEISKLAFMVGGFDQINIGMLGDSFDGWDGETTRGGHKLPQSLDNRQAFTTFLTIYKSFIDSLVALNLSNRIHFYFVANSNHGGDFDYIAYKTLEMYMQLVYPDIVVKIFEKFVNHFHYGVHTYIITHGKDQENRKYGFPLVINEQTKGFINDYMKLNSMQPHVHFVKGDLHRSNLDLDRMCSSQSSFTYQNVASVFGASKWIMDNFGATMPIVDYEIVSKTDYRVLRGHIYLK